MTSDDAHTLLPAEFQAIFESSPTLCLILSPQFTIVGATHAYLRETLTRREEVVGRNIFDVFPDNPDSPDADGVRNLRRSLERVLATRATDTMAIQKYDIRLPESEGGAFAVRYWSPINAPVFNSKQEVEYIVHRVENVTDFVLLKEQGKQLESEVFLRQQELRQANHQLQVANAQISRNQADLEDRVVQRTADLNDANNALQSELKRRIETEQSLWQQTEKLRLILNSIDDGVIFTNAEGQVEQLNSKAEQLTGWSPSAALRVHLSLVFQAFREPGLTPFPYDAHLQNILWIKSGLEEHWLLQARDGTQRSIEFSVTPLFEASQKLTGMVLTFRDITERHRLEQLRRDLNTRLEQEVQERTKQLRASEQQFRLLVEGTKDYAIYLLDPDGRVVTWNPGAKRIKGYETSEIVGQHFSRFYTDADLHRGAPAKDLRIARSEGRIEEEVLRVRKDGTTFWAHVVMTALFDDEGTLYGFSKITRDITKNRAAEETQLRLLQEETARRLAEKHSQAIWEQRERLRVTLQSIGDGVVTTDAEGKVQFLNPIAQNLTGWTEEDAIGHALLEVFEIINEDTRETVENPAIRALRDGVIVGLANHTLLISKDGTERPIADSAAPIRDEAGKIIGVVLVFRDMTEAKQLEGQFRQSQKMEAVGRLAGGIAHDFNNLLTVILSYCEYLEEDVSLSNDAIESATEIRKAGVRAATLTKQLLAFSRQQILHPTVLNLNDVVAEMGALLGRVIGEDVSLGSKLAPRLWQTRVDKGQMEQVLVNLAVNARDAMPQGGKLTIETANIELDESFSWSVPDVKPGQYVMVSVSDTGCGMDETVKNRIFEPFFTTKDAGKGTGLGLATVFGIVKQSEGHITVYSEPGHGATFKIYIPRVDRNGDTHEEERSPTQPRRGTETVLVVEDEDMVRKLASRILRSNGYQVVEARNGKEALQVFEEQQTTFHLVLTDVVMPEMSGRELSQILRNRQPDLKVLFMSGYTDDAVVRHGVLEAESNYLQKPFSPGALSSKVRDVLDRQTTLPTKDVILLVDDEEVVRKSTSVLLKAAGFTTLEASSAAEAISICEQLTTPIHLVLTDITMPDMNGQQLAKKLLAIRPHLKMLFMSGYPLEEFQTPNGFIDKDNFLPKPSPTSALTKKIRDLLTRH